MQKPHLAAYIIVFDGKMLTLMPILNASSVPRPRQVDFCRPIEGTCQLLVRFYLSKNGSKMPNYIMFSYATMWNDEIKCCERKETK